MGSLIFFGVVFILIPSRLILMGSDHPWSVLCETLVIIIEFSIKLNGLPERYFIGTRQKIFSFELKLQNLVASIPSKLPLRSLLISILYSRTFAGVIIVNFTLHVVAVNFTGVGN